MKSVIVLSLASAARRIISSLMRAGSKVQTLVTAGFGLVLVHGRLTSGTYTVHTPGSRAQWVGM